MKPDRALYAGMLAARRPSSRKHTHSVVDLGASEPADILNLRADTLWTAEENERLVDQVCSKVVGLTISGQRKVLPGTLQGRAETVEAGQ